MSRWKLTLEDGSVEYVRDAALVRARRNWVKAELVEDDGFSKPALPTPTIIWKLTFANGEIGFAASAREALLVAARVPSNLIDAREVPGDVVRGVESTLEDIMQKPINGHKDESRWRVFQTDGSPREVTNIKIADGRLTGDVTAETCSWKLDIAMQDVAKVERITPSWGIKCPLVDANSVMQDWYLMPASAYPDGWTGDVSRAQRFNSCDEARAVIVRIAAVADSMESRMVGPCVPAMRVLGQLVVGRCLYPVEMPEPKKP